MPELAGNAIRRGNLDALSQRIGTRLDHSLQSCGGDAGGSQFPWEFHSNFAVGGTKQPMPLLFGTGRLYPMSDFMTRAGDGRDGE
jgi:hypothetical protein